MWAQQERDERIVSLIFYLLPAYTETGWEEEDM
jgi:hypothetical protein